MNREPCAQGGRTRVSPDHAPVREMPAQGHADRGGDYEARLSLLVGELNHRMRNLLTMVEAIVGRTQAADVDDFRATVLARISGLHSVLELVGTPDESAAHLADLVEQTLPPYCAASDARRAASEARVQAVGPAVELHARLALALHLVLHELATNAAKHGALSTPGGWVKIRWDLLRGDGQGRRLAIVWSEHGGPDVETPRRQGFGTRLITRALSRDTPGEVELTFRPSGLVCRIVVELDRPLTLPNRSGSERRSSERCRSDRSRRDDADPDRFPSLN